MRIAYIGLGAMGLPVATHLAAAGHQLLVFDQSAAALDNARTEGLKAASSLAGCVESAQFVFTCLPSEQAVRDVYAHIDKPDLICCDNSTIGPALARTLHARLAQQQIAYVECPMLGGVGEARAGTLFLIVSGNDDDIDKVLPLAVNAARDHRRVGGPGNASLFKTVQNGLGHIQAAGIAEALTLVARAGGDVERFIDVVSAGGGMASTPLFRARAPMMRDLPEDAPGKLYIAAKDAILAKTLADQLQLDLPLLKGAAAVYEKALAMGLAEEDMAAIIRVLEDVTSQRVAKS
jgi:3-hydroxyisobutyrate dehydrogenase-like beta-hydroxyacid dehydrogenase